eukprot:GFUD01028540.1.p1 GENE.GFUD01028540.1~~GFUD01028540.1.p1  ORF type:complete len:1050 (-),score=275.67 GFUD01028540.1:766-3915(-)
MSLETRSNSALMKRAEQLKRWQDSETFREPSEPKRKSSRRVGFSDGCVFLAACAAGDREEVKVLLGRGADIDTANVDGLTALHQACIDDNLDMVEFLVANGADVNRGDNEGWTPLHATASCGFLSIAKFLLDHGANVAAVNNDGELAIDISESDEMEDLLQKEIDVRQINCEDARNKEEQCMLDDARDWYNSGNFGDRAHAKTGATALHVAAAKGYIKVINLLIQAGSEINQQDFDGWTPLHAAAHWAQREACEMLAENYVNMDIKNCVGQTPFDVADPDVLRLLEELKKKQNTLQKDRPDIKALINRPPTTPGINNKGGRRSSITRLSQQDKIHSTKEATVKETIKEEKVATSRDANESDKDSSTDTSESDDSSLSESVAVAPRSVPVDPFHSDTDIQTARIYQSSPLKPSRTLDSPGVVVTDESGKEAPGFLPPHPETNQGKDDSAPWRRPGSLRARPTNSGLSSGKLSPSTEDLVTVRRAHSFGSDEKFYAKLAELRQRIRANSMPTLNKDPDNLPLNPLDPNTEIHSSTLPKPHRKSISEMSTSSLPRQPKSRLPSVIESQQLNLTLADDKPPLPPKPSPPLPYSKYIISPQPYRRSDEKVPDSPPSRFSLPTPGAPPPPVSVATATNSGVAPISQHDQDWRKVSEDIITKQSPDLRPRSIENLSVSKSNPGAPPQQAQVRRSFVPPVRDEEHEIQRKAHAKRVRETRRSTQGVTLEDLKSAEQLVKKKQQQENAQRTTELQQLASSSPTSIGSTATPTTGSSSPSPGTPTTPSTPTPPGSTATTTVTTSATLVTGGSRDSDQERHERRPSWRLRIETNDKSRFTLEDTREKLANSTTSSQSPERRISRLDPVSVREQRHSVHVPNQTTTPTHGGESEGSTSGTPTQLTAIQRKKKPKRRSTGVVQLELDDIDPRSEDSTDENVPTSSSQTNQEFKTKSNLKSQNGEIDYKKLWEESQAENARLRLDMNAIRSDLDSTRHQLEAAIQASAKNSVSDTEKREKKVLEKKLAEMEEELKTLDQLKADNQRLRDENGALIRVISKLSK